MRNPRGLIRLAITAAQRGVLWVLVGAVLAAAPHAARAIDTNALQAILVDDATGTVLFEKNSDQTMFPASMSKLMTLYIVFEHVAQQRISLDDKLTVSEKAWRMRGSRMFVEVNEQVTVADLLRGIVVQSGNDACIVLAEAVAGTEEAFANLMNQTAARIGLSGSHFVNSTGWPHPQHVTTARDLAILSHRIIHDFPQFYGLFAERSFTYATIEQGNRNPLLYRYDGADGLKTGHTDASGYGLAASAVQNGRRLILVINGLPSTNARSREAEGLLNYGFREFKNYTLFDAGDVVDTFDVWLGERDEVPLVTERPVTVTLSRGARSGLEVKIVAPGPIRAPVTKGDTVAKLVVSAPGVSGLERPLVAGADVGKLSGIGRIGAAINHLIWGSGR